MSKPDYTNPPPHYQVMTIANARQEYPEDPIATIKDFCKTFELEDGHWCYINWYRALDDLPRRPMVIAMTTMDKEWPGRFETYEAACRMAWYSHLQTEMLGCNTPMQEIDRLVGKFQKDGTL